MPQAPQEQECLFFIAAGNVETVSGRASPAILASASTPALGMIRNNASVDQRAKGCPAQSRIGIRMGLDAGISAAPDHVGRLSLLRHAQAEWRSLTEGM